MSRFTDLTGLTFGRFTVISREKNRRYGDSHFTMWMCHCSCGKDTIVSGTALRTGRSKSCGCANHEKLKHLATVHGGHKTRLYFVWTAMLARCKNSNNRNYSNYGGRGISVCDAWSDYVKFRDWALSSGYDPKAKRGECTIDRINPDGNYCPENCRFVDIETNNANQRRIINAQKRKVS